MMEKLSSFLLSLFLINFFFCPYLLVLGIESPQFTVVHSESDFEIRLYRDSSWMSASVRGISFDKATKEGFHRLYQYIHGGNMNSSRLVMTAPILTSVIPGTQSSEYTVRFYLSTKWQEGPPPPLPELNLQFGKWGNHCVAVRTFSGFSTDENIIKEVDSLVNNIGRSHLANSAVFEDKYGYMIAQYNASFRATGRLNEVWMNVTGYAREGCPMPV
ncbi:uncharacterized protein LOC143854021 [Tasmannia lanceolata]|uniref:uncharacterized protein LOC143854021 n=1 Tax=Tasmannia lanceolata TaxID=3420 RepID=UPI0040632344